MTDKKETARKAEEMSRTEFLRGVKEVREASSVEEANSLLDSGWHLVAIGFRNNAPYYSLVRR